MSETTTENQPERLIVKNFGPLKDVDIELKDIMVFIGPQASGKSTLAKILYIFTKGDLVFTENKNELFGNVTVKELFQNESINFFSENTEFHFKTNKKIVDYTNGKFKLGGKSYNLGKNILTWTSSPLNWLINKSIGDDEETTKYIIFNAIKKSWSESEYFTYIPAERILISSLSDSLMGLISARNVNLSNTILNFGSKFEIARKTLKKVKIDFLGIEYNYGNMENAIVHSNGVAISLSEASSGTQSVIPLYVTIKYVTQKDNNNSLVIEEPELNLFPETQKKLVEFIIETCRDKTKRLIITTHSPYILTTLNGLIQAHNTARTKPELKDKVAEIVPENRWIDFDKIGVYHVADGTVKRIMDDEYRLIDANPIDDVSDKLGREFDELLDLKYD
jgi:predicted ATPase